MMMMIVICFCVDGDEDDDDDDVMMIVTMMKMMMMPRLSASFTVQWIETVVHSTVLSIAVLSTSTNR
jgi:hypothetical protein